MAAKKQIGNGSVGIQADRDVTVNIGLAVAEVKKLTEFFLKENFPQLRKDAMDVAHNNVQRFLSTFEAQLAQRLGDVDIGKFGTQTCSLASTR